MRELRRDYTSRLFRLASRLFLYLVSFRRKLRKGYQVGHAMVQEDLERIFTEMEHEALRDPRTEALYNRAKYPLVVFADEILLNSDWEYAPVWTEGGTFEEKYFETNIGGDRIFQIASELQYNEVELAAILYTILALGFKGRHGEDPQKLEEVKNKLFRHLSEYLADVRKDQITPDAYRVEPSKARRLSPVVTLARVLIVAFGFVVLYWLASMLSWKLAISDLEGVVAGLLRGGL